MRTSSPAWSGAPAGLLPIGAPASAIRCVQSQNGPGSQCIPATYASSGPGTSSWPMTCSRSSGMPYFAARYFTSAADDSYSDSVYQLAPDIA